jgi:glutamate 5-kinase
VAGGDSVQKGFREFLANAKRIVVKVGATNLTDEQSKLDVTKIKNLVKDIMRAHEGKKEIILVTSAAIGAGISRLNLGYRPKEMPLLQAAAAVGQAILMNVYESYFGNYNQPIAQILLTYEDFRNEERHKNFGNTIDILLKWGVIPIVNENDTVAIEEIKIGDNDLLSALVATSVKADLLLILSDVDGLYTGDPRIDKEAKLIKTVENFTPQIENLEEMHTKIQAAKIVGEKGAYCVIANGNERGVVSRVLSGEEIGTVFLAEKSR